MNHPWLLLINPMLANKENILYLGKKIKNLRQIYKLWTLPSSTIFSSNLYKNGGDNENEWGWGGRLGVHLGHSPKSLLTCLWLLIKPGTRQDGESLGGKSHWEKIKMGFCPFWGKHLLCTLIIGWKICTLIVQGDWVYSLNGQYYLEVYFFLSQTALHFWLWVYFLLGQGSV